MRREKANLLKKTKTRISGCSRISLSEYFRKREQQKLGFLNTLFLLTKKENSEKIIKFGGFRRSLIFGRIPPNFINFPEFSLFIITNSVFKKPGPCFFLFRKYSLNKIREKLKFRVLVCSLYPFYSLNLFTDRARIPNVRRRKSRIVSFCRRGRPSRVAFCRRRCRRFRLWSSRAWNFVRHFALRRISFRRRKSRRYLATRCKVAERCPQFHIIDIYFNI